MVLPSDHTRNRSHAPICEREGPAQGVNSPEAAPSLTAAKGIAETLAMAGQAYHRLAARAVAAQGRSTDQSPAPEPRHRQGRTWEEPLAMAGPSISSVRATVQRTRFAVCAGQRCVTAARSRAMPFSG